MGPLRIEFSTPVSLEQVRSENPALQTGGRYKPKDCIALQKVAIIIPFRKRDEHLKFWLYYLHPILQRQQLDYGIYIINQVSPLHRPGLSCVSAAERGQERSAFSVNFVCVLEVGIVKVCHVSGGVSNGVKVCNTLSEGVTDASRPMIRVQCRGTA